MITKLKTSYESGERRSVCEYTLESGDLELLQSKPIPKNPCQNCDSSYACCGCPEYSRYLANLKVYEEKGMLGVAKLIEEILNIESQIESLQKTVSIAKSTLPKEVVNLLDNGDMY